LKCRLAKLQKRREGDVYISLAGRKGGNARELSAFRQVWEEKEGAFLKWAQREKERGLDPENRS